jgi:uncharacterized peroxidase-related enzyme
MSKLDIIDPARTEGKTADLLAAVRKMLGTTPNMFRLTANAPAALESMVAQFAATAHCKLPAKAREAIALTVAEFNGCDYCLSAHTALGKGAGLSENELRRARAADASDPKLRAMLVFARTLVAERGKASPEMLEGLRRAGITDQEVVEVIANVALNVFTNYVNIALGTDIDFPIVRAGS